MTSILNRSDVECGIQIEFKALTKVTNPAVINVETGEKTRLNFEMEAGDVIIIDTEYGKKKLLFIVTASS